MSDYGYRPDPPPEDGRSFGGAGQSGRARGSASPGNGSYGSASNNPPNNADYGWGGSQQSGTGSYGGGGAPAPGPYRTPASGSASVGRASGSASVGRASGSASVGGPGRASVGGAGRASVGSASVGSAAVGGARPIDLGEPEVHPVSPAGRATVGGKRRAGSEPLSEDDLAAQKKLKKKKRRKKIYAGLMAVGVMFVGAITVVGAWFFQDIPLPDTLRRAGESSTFYYADGSTEAGGYGESLRQLVDSPDEIPATVREALVALEDRKFYDHGGVNYTRTMAALVNNVTGGEQQGASTITQQYAGMVAEIRNDISYGRKAKEAVMAMKLEQEYSKDEILMHYLNLAYFGRGATGIEAAAKVYFDTPLAELDYDQAAFIVMQVKSPNGYYDPFYTDQYDEEATVARWNHTMDSMVEVGYLSQEERDGFEMPTPLMEGFEVSGSWGGDTSLGFIINEQDGYIFEELEQRFGISKEELYGGDDQPGGFQVTLTIDQEIQRALEQTNSRGEIKAETNDQGQYVDEEDNVVESSSQAEKVLTEEGYWQFENTNEEAALAEYEPYMTSAQVAIDADTGAVVGYYGGDDGFGIDKAGPESPHPPSSTFKMVTAATAIEHDASIESWWDASSPRRFDSLTNEEQESCIGGGDYPDCSLRNGGTVDSNNDMTLTDAVRKSQNTPMYAISEEYGAAEILKYADDMGLSTMSQTRQLTDDCGDKRDVSIMYQLHDDGTYTQHGEAVDANGEWIVDPYGNIARHTPLKLDGNNPMLDCEGRFYADEDGELDKRDVGGNGDTDPFYNHLSFGQYPTSVRDMAAMYATIANDGLYNETHFIASVTDRNGNPVPEVDPLEQKQAIAVETARDLQWVGSEISGEASTGLEFAREYFGKTGTWEASGKDKDGQDYPESYNAHAWYVGAIPQLSIATWVGNLTAESDPIADPNGDKTNVYGSNTAYPVWHAAMEKILESKDGEEGWDEVQWEGKAVKGSPITTDIENEDGTIDPDSAYCGAKPEDPKCGSQEEEDEEESNEENCEGNGNGNGNNQDCETEPGDGDGDGNGGETSPGPGDVTDEPTGDEDCGLWPGQGCDEETTPTEEQSPTEESGNRQGG
ncbi:transglycosylase domain-containing protein [Glycomyces tarimensis]